MQIRALEAGDWETLRTLRLSALEESPDAFGPTHESALRQPHTYWAAWATGRPGRLRAFGAFNDLSEPLGLISGGIPRGSDVGHWGALWVAPVARGSGIAVQLIEAMCEWLASQGCTRIELEVTDGNPAEKLYRALGFERTGARKQMREDSPLFEVTMSRPVVATPGSE